MEYAVPAEKGAAVLREVRDMIKRERMPVNYPIEFRFVKGDDIPLSPFYQRDSAVLSFHVYAGKPHRRYFDAVEAICRRYDGRPHWGKMHGLDAADFRAIYPRFEDFQQLRRELDPKGTFLSPYMRRVFEAAGTPLDDRAAAQ
jgi:L-gulonolactone oxidase